jgi:LysM repeat protein
MDSFRDGQPPDELPDDGSAHNDAAADFELERELMPPEDAAISPELLDELFDEKDPRVQSGTNERDPDDDDLDFIRMSGLTSPDVPKHVGALTPKAKDPEPDLPDPVSFYEPGVADVDESMHREHFDRADERPTVESPVTGDADKPAVENDAIAELLAGAEPDAPGASAAPDNDYADAAAEPESLEPVELEQVQPGQDELPLLVPVDAADADTDAIEPAPPGLSPDDIGAALSAIEGKLSAIETRFDQEESGTPPPAEEPVEALTGATEGLEAETSTNEPPLSETFETAPMDPSQAASDTVKPPPVDLAPPDADDDEVFADLLTPNVDVTPAEAPNAAAENEPESIESGPYAAADLSTIEAENQDLGDNTPLDDDGLDKVLIEADGSKANQDDAPAQPPVFAASEADFEELHSVQEYGHRRMGHRRHKRSTWKSAAKAAAVSVIFGGAIAYAGYEAYRWFEIQISNPTTLFYQAEEAAANGRYLQASRLYEEFARRNAGHHLAPDAMFGAGYAMQQVEADDAELTHQYNEEALALLSDFTRDYPEHPRAGRAQSLMGLVHYRTGNYRAAVDAFIDRDAVLRDPVATLPMLRTLARSYAELGDFEAAHDAYIRAANSPGNPSPDQDYDELGEMYRTLAQSTEAPEQHAAFEAMAVEQWTQAIRYPGINPSRKNAIRVKVDLLEELGKMDQAPSTEAINVSRTDVVVPVDAASATPMEFDTPEAFSLVSREVRPIEPETTPAPEHEPVFEVVTELDQMEKPIAGDSGPETGEARYHEIKRGDQLMAIALEHGLTLDELMSWNGIENADHIEMGQVLRLNPPEREGAE